MKSFKSVLILGCQITKKHPAILLFQIIQLLYFIIAPLGDVVTLLSGRKDNWLVKLRDLLFSSLAFPLGVVSVLINFYLLIYLLLIIYYYYLLFINYLLINLLIYCFHL